VSQRTCDHDPPAASSDRLDVLSAAAVLSIAARHVESEGVQGSCTACLLTINKESGKLQSATLGDSGFLIVGRGPQSSVNAENEVSLPACISLCVCQCTAGPTASNKPASQPAS
jgi:hypothetical protein